MKNTLSVSLATLCLGASAGGAMAQEAPASATGSDTQLEEIVVTSQKRKEDVQEIPISISTISGDELQANQIVSFDDLSRNVPNLSFQSQAGPGLSTLEMRGVSSQAGGSTVGIYMDEVSMTTRYLYSMGMPEPQFFDLQRVEVLRGPQGTLYGASSMGGTIRFISNQPDPGAFSANATAQVSQTEHGGTNNLLQAVVNEPLWTGAALRVGLQQGHESGYIDQVNPTTLRVINKGIDGANWDVEKAALRMKLGPDWILTPAVFAQQYRAEDIDGAYLNVPSYQVGNGQTGLTGPNLPLYETSKIVREPGDDHLTVTSVTADGDLHFADFTGILSDYKRNFKRIQDGTYVNSNYVAYEALTAPYETANPNSPAVQNLVNTINGLPSLVYLNNTVGSDSLELRLHSKDYDATLGPFTWIGGTYLSRTQTDVSDNEPIYGINSAFQAFSSAIGVPNTIGNPNYLAGAYPNDFPGDNSYFSYRHYADRQYSLFGELTTHFSKALRMETGLRWVSAAQHFARQGDFYFTGSPVESVADVDTKGVAFTPDFKLEWDVDPTTMLYAAISKGFRTGGANRPIPLAFLQQSNLTEPSAFQPDHLWNYEIGSKSTLWDRRLTLNLAAYHIDWSNIQQDVPVAGGYDFETNVGTAHSDGFEFDSRVRILRGLTLLASGNWTRAVFTENIPAVSATAGETLPGVPKLMLHLGMEERFPVGADTNGVFRLNGNYTGSSYGTWLTSSPDYTRPAYFTCDANAGLSFGRWEVNAFAKNLNGNHTVIQQMPIQTLNEALYLRPRTIGLSLTGEI